MKKIIFAACLCIATTSLVNAQTQKGNLFVGASIGNTSYSSATDNYSYSDGNFRNTDIKINRIGLSPRLGVFVTDHFIVGGSFGLNYIHNKTNDDITENSLQTSA